MNPTFDRIASRVRLGAAMALACSASTAVMAAPPSLTYDTFLEIKGIDSPLQAGSTMRLEGKLIDTTSTIISNTLFFRVGATELSVSAGWLVAPPENRTVGVNIDLFDRFHTLVASDIFQASNGSIATSRLNAGNLLAGALYELVLTGTAAQFGRYELALTAGSGGPAVGALPAATPALNQVLFDTHAGTKTFGNRLEAGGEIFIDGKMADDVLGTVSNEFEFVNTAGTLSAGIEWIICQPGDPERTIAFNVDILDSNNVLVVSDTFQGLQGDQGFSQFVTAISPGSYKARITGIAPLGSRYRVHLATTDVPPGFERIGDSPPVTNVPEPATWALLVVGLGAAFAHRRLQSRR